jgi:mannose-6-phosphate isomerase-like protein (cupin superfamily)
MTLGGGFKLPSREGHQIAAIGLGITMKINGKDSPPPHIHTREDESFICLAGKLDVFLGGEDFTIGPGDYLYLPRDIVHTFRNTYDAESRVISVVSPAGLEGYYEALAAMPPGPKDIGKIKLIMADFGIALQLPPGAS